MTEPKRYSLVAFTSDGHGELRECTDGTFVTYSDYEALRTARPAADREEVARIIDPDAWRCPDGYYIAQEGSDEALAKADQIIARLRATTPGGELEHFRTFDTRGTKMARRCTDILIECENGEVANRVADQLRSVPTPGAVAEPAAFVPLHPRTGPLWAETYPADRDVSEARSSHYERRPLYTHPAPASDGAPVTLTYTNYRGETALRTILPKSIRYGSTEWHPEPQWLLLALDVEKNADREFALKDFGQPSDGAIREAYIAGATAVHNEWIAATDRGEEPPRGEPDFNESASDYAALAGALCFLPSKQQKHLRLPRRSAGLPRPRRDHE